MQGGARSVARGVLAGTSQRRGSAPTQQMGLFSSLLRNERPSSLIVLRQVALLRARLNLNRNEPDEVFPRFPQAGVDVDFPRWHLY